MGKGILVRICPQKKVRVANLKLKSRQQLGAQLGGMAKRMAQPAVDDEEWCVQFGKADHERNEVAEIREDFCVLACEGGGRYRIE